MIADVHTFSVPIFHSFTVLTIARSNTPPSRGQQVSSHQKWIWGIHCTQARMHAIERSILAWNPGRTPPEVQNTGNSGPTQRTDVLQFFFLKKPPALDRTLVLWKQIAFMGKQDYFRHLFPIFKFLNVYFELPEDHLKQVLPEISSKCCNFTRIQGE